MQLQSAILIVIEPFQHQLTQYKSNLLPGTFFPAQVNVDGCVGLLLRGGRVDSFPRSAIPIVFGSVRSFPTRGRGMNVVFDADSILWKLDIDVSDGRADDATVI